MSKIRNKLIATLTIFAMLFTSLSAVMFAGSNFAKAEGEESAVVGVFQLQDGASSGYIDEEEKYFAGLRWETKINKAYYNSLTANGETLEFGTLIAPAEFEDYLNFDPNADKKIVFEDGDWYIDGITNKKGEKIYVSNIVNEYAVSNLKSYEDEEAGTDDLSGEYIMRSAIRYDELDENLIAQAKTELVAKAYVKITNGENVTYNYSEADTVRSLRNSVAYNLAAGNFSEADATSLKKFAVAEDKTYAKLDGEVLYSVNNEAYRETTVTFDALQGKDAEFALNSKSIDVGYNKETGVVTLGANFFVDLKQGVHYLTAFCADGNVYYTEVLKATTISTANDLAMFRLVEEESANVNGSNYSKTPDTIDVLNTFDGYYVLTNNIDASTMTDRLYSWAHNTVDYEAGNSSVMFTKGLTGTFDGRGYAISNLKVYRGGLFGIINGTVKNVAFQNINHYTYGSYLCANSAFLAHRMTSTGVMENVAIFAPTNTVNSGIINKFTVGATFTNCYFESPYISALSPRAVQNVTYGYPRWDTNYFGNSSNLVIVSPFIFNGAGVDNCFDMIDVTGGKGYRGNTSTEVTPETLSANATLKRYQSAEDLATRYALGDNDTLAINKKVETTKTVIDSFENCGNFAVIDGKICWASLSQVYLNNELLTVSELELAVGESAEIKVFNMVGEATPDFEIISDSDSVSISNGTILAVKPGSANLSVVSKGVVLAKLTVNAPKNVVDNTAKTIIVDADGEAFTAPENFIVKTSVNVDGVTVDYTDGVLKLLNATAGTEYIVTFETAEAIYNYKVKYVTAYIRTAEEFVKTFSFGSDDNLAETITAVTDLPNFNGYYLLANNIDFADKQMLDDSYTYGSASTISAYATSGIKGNYGLTGTFDGDGYYIKNLKVSPGGVFGVISGAVKNVAFDNIDFVTTTQTGLLAKYIYGSAELSNIYLKYNGVRKNNLSLLTTSAGTSVLLNNCYFDGKLPLTIGITDDAATSFNPSGVTFGNTNNKVIVISEYIIGARGGSFNQGYGSWMDGNTSGSTPVEPKNPQINSASNVGGTASYRAKGSFYRYVSVEEMSSIYTEAKTVKNWTWYAEDGTTRTGNLRTIYEEVTGLTTKQTALTTLLSNWDKTYFDVVYTKADAENPEKVTSVSISWKTKTA